MSDNLIVRIPGITTPDEAVIVCAHYDSTSENPYNRAPGADDNASGAAAVLTAASILISWTPMATTPFAIWRTEGWSSGRGFFRVKSE